MQIRRKFEEVGLSSVEPEGWLRRYLEKQRDGLTGHLEVAGFPFDTNGWAGRRIYTQGEEESEEHWWPYEQTGYWVDGMIRCGHLLGDEFLLGKARKSLDYVLDHADADGYLGLQFLKQPRERYRWPHAVFFRAMMAEYSATKDKRIVKALRDHYLSGTSPHCYHRDICNVEIMLWVYERTKDKRLLKMAVKAYEEYNRATEEPGPDVHPLNGRVDTTVKGMLSGRRGFSHGVTYNEICKLGALLYVHTGNRRHLRATVNAYRKIDKFHMLIDGVHSSTERLRGKEPLDSHETCDIADYTWAVGYLLQITGEAAYADKIERACFNAGPGAVTSNFRAVQYFSCPNQVIADKASNHNAYRRGGARMSYRPEPHVACCPGEVNRIMPNYAGRMWLGDGKGGLVAALYGPSRITAKVGAKQQAVTIVQETDYPFSEVIDFSIRTAGPVRFGLTLRVPGWCRRARLEVNGRAHGGKLRAGSFVKITRTFEQNDRVRLVLPMDVKLSRWPKGGVGVERGPLVYALRIEEDWRVDKEEKNQTKEFPAWNLYPASAWNYALDLTSDDVKEKVEVVHKAMSAEPWSIDSAPIELHVPARKVRGWKIVRSKKVVAEPETLGIIKGNFALTPDLPEAKSLRKRLSKKVETVRLVPYGCTKLRIAVFPKCK